MNASFRVVLSAQRIGSRRNRPRRLRNQWSSFELEIVEARVLLASIAGSSYIDLNGDGVRQNNEGPLAGATVYLDTNHNQRFDAGEPSTTTDANGAYLFTNLSTGNYLVEEVPPASWKITSPPSAAPAATKALPAPQVASEYSTGAHQLVARSVPNDPLFPDQWHLLNYGQTGGTPGADANVTPVWDQFQGDGVTIGVVDDGMDTTHPDLAPNYDPADSYDFDDNDSDPSPGDFDDHGTAVAGVAAARSDNGIGVSGAAPHANIAAIRLIADVTTDQMEADALSYHKNNIDIYSNSWGPDDDGETLEGPGPLALAALHDGVTNGRNGKGNIYVWAAGNGLLDDDNTNYDGYANNRYVIAVSAIDHNGVQSEYSEPGAPILVAAYSDNIDNDPGIVTTDRQGGDGYTGSDYTDLIGDGAFGGTSSATPLVSGVVALMLQANPSLTWRDVQAIIANSARKNDVDDSGWSQNGAKHWINDKYGFGAIDGAAAVALAQTWTNLPPETSISSGTINVNQAIPDNNPTGRSSTFTTNRLMKVEKVEVGFDATHPFRGDLRVVLTSPDGTQSVLAAKHFDPNEDYTHWTFTTVRDFDEIAKGTWTLKVTDGAKMDAGTWNSWSINLYGTNLGSADYLQITNSQANLTAPDFGNLPPPALHVTSANFPSDIAGNRLLFTFDQDVSSVIAASDIQITNQTTGATVPTNQIHVNYNASAKTATFSVIGLDHATLADGNYTAILSASSFNLPGGISLDGNNDGTAGDDFTFAFFELKGDANHDRVVNTADLAIVLSHLGNTSATLSQGDLNYDGKVDFQDFQTIELTFGNSLPSPAVAVAQSAAPLSKSAKPASRPVAKVAPKVPTAVPKSIFSTTPVRRRMEILDSRRA